MEPFRFEEVKRRRGRKTPSGKAGEAVYRILLTAMLFTAVYFIMSVFFVVKNIEVTGAQHYLPEYVAGISGIEIGDKLLFINFNLAPDMFEKLPYVKEIKVRQKFPNTALLELTERKPAAKFKNGGITYIIDNEGYLLEYTAMGDEIRLPVINGVKPLEYIPGKQLVYSEELMLESLKAVLEGIVSSEWISDIVDINLEKVYAVSFNYQNRFTVEIGDTSSLDKKLAVLPEVLDRLGSSSQGIINISNPEKVRFRPYTS